MAAPLLAEAVGGTAFLGFISAVAFATILAVVAGPRRSRARPRCRTISGSHVVRKGEADEREQLTVARFATVLLAVVAIVLGIVFKGQNVAFMVGPRVRDRRERELPGAAAVDVVAGFTTRGRGREHA